MDRLFFAAAVLALGSLSYGRPGGYEVPLGVLCLSLAWVLLALRQDRAGRGSWSPGQGPPDLLNRRTLAAVLALGAVLRFWRLTTYHAWPTGDEGLHGFLALDLLRHWDWRFFYTVGEHPPLLIWALRLMFGWSQAPFFVLWSLPALMSLLALGLGYGAARLYFPRPFAACCAFLLALGFWPLETGRFCHQGLFVPPFELGCFWLWGLWIRARDARQGRRWAFGLGLVLGLGSLTFTAWGAVVIFFTLAAAAWARERWDARKGGLGFFALGLALGALPFAAAVLRQGYGAHLMDVSSARGWFTLARQFSIGSAYLTSVLWGPGRVPEDYGPVWGGMLGPLLGAAFLLGLAELWRNRRSSLARWTAGGLLLAFLPGLLSADYVEMFRVVQAMPLVLLTAAFGLHRLASGFPPRRRGPVLVLILVLSAGFSVTQFLKASDPPLAASVPADENARAYVVLRAQAQAAGPGLVFADSMLLSHGHTLAVAVHPFNAAENGALDPAQARWAAVIANVNYGPFLARRFPGLRWVPVGQDLSSDGGLAVGLLPVTPEDRNDLQRWLAADRYFHRLSVQAEGILNDPVRYARACAALPQGDALMRGDRFLESIDGEWCAQYHYAPGDYAKNRACLERALREGYPAAHLYFKLGNFDRLDGLKPQAAEAYRKALAVPGGRTLAGEALASLGGR